jgi:plasmid maintenance system antidote protein VapI
MLATNKITRCKKTTQSQWRKLMDERGLKQTWVATKAGISPAHLCNILAERSLLTDDIRARINKVLGTDY